MLGEVYPMPVSEYLNGERLKNLAVASLGRILGGDKVGMISYPAERWLILRHYVKPTGVCKFHWCLYATEYEVTNEGMAFYREQFGHRGPENVIRSANEIESELRRAAFALKLLHSKTAAE